MDAANSVRYRPLGYLSACGAPRGACRIRQRMRTPKGLRFSARHMRSNSPEGGSARYLQRPYGVGPRFNPGLPVRDLTASSWRGLLVVPGGAPMPPECLVATRPAGAAPRPAHATPRESAPLTDEVVGVYGRFGVRG